MTSRDKFIKNLILICKSKAKTHQLKKKNKTINEFTISLK